MKKLLSIILVLAIMVGCFGVTAEPTRHGVGKNLLGFNTTDLNGNTVTGDIISECELTIINLWATWCGPCVSEMPHFQELHEHYQATPENDVQMIGVVSEGGGCTVESARAFLEQNGYTWLNLREDSVLGSALDSGYIPQTIIVDRNGVVRDHIIGAFSGYNQLIQYIEGWLDVIRNHEGETCTVSYVNSITGETIGTQEVAYGYSFEPQFPEVPAVEGYTFKEWTLSGDYMTGGYDDCGIAYIAVGDVTFTANFDRQKFKVKFYDGVTGNLINVQQVYYGDAAVEPNHPEHEGYTFTGWDTDFSCVTEALLIHGICVPDQQNIPGDVNGDGALTVADATLIMRMALGLMESVPEADFNGDGNISVADATLVMRAALGL